MNRFLQLAAWGSLMVAMTLLLIRLFWPKLAPTVHARRFRRRLGKVDTVLAAWTEEVRAQEEGNRHEQRHPEPTDD